MFIVVLAIQASANMYDVIEETKLAPTTCTNGCAEWATLGYENCNIDSSYFLPPPRLSSLGMLSERRLARHCRRTVPVSRRRTCLLSASIVSPLFNISFVPFFSRLRASVDAMWADGTPPANAGSSCAQPGKGVNSRIYGAWCFCANSSQEMVR